MIPLTPERREHIAERLREFTPEVDEPAVQRALFAISCRELSGKGEACSVCGADLKTRPVLSEVHNSARSKAVYDQRFRGQPPELELPPAMVMRNVHKKPLQLVITARIEGSHGDRKRADVPDVLFRFCLDCLDQVKP